MASKTATTANLTVKFLRGAMSSARRLGFALTNPAEAVTTLSESESDERVPFTPDQTRDLLKAADPEWRGMILFGYHTGRRLHDAANLTWQNIELGLRTITFCDQKTSTRNGEAKGTPSYSCTPT
ncbi:MAG: hypothetical protein ACR2NX_07035 [Chthoniobacterales bacterium]